MIHFRFEKAVGKYLNTKWTTNEGYEVEIIEYFTNSNCTIQFIKNNKIIKYKVTIQNLKMGKIKYPYHPSVYGVGFVGIGKYTPSVGRKDTKVYKHWSSMLQRGYSNNLKEKYPTYKDVTVCEEWHNFQNFAEWYEEDWKPHMAGWHLDKDVLIKGNKIYSPETCTLIPNEINLLFIKTSKARGKYPLGVSKHGNKFQVSLSTNGRSTFLGDYLTIEEAFKIYKVAKEHHIKEIANK
jgi:hypothetical protein